MLAANRLVESASYRIRIPLDQTIFLPTKTDPTWNIVRHHSSLFYLYETKKKKREARFNIKIVGKPVEGNRAKNENVEILNKKKTNSKCGMYQKKAQCKYQIFFAISFYCNRFSAEGLCVRTGWQISSFTTSQLW